MKNRIYNAKKEYDKVRKTKWRGAESAFYISDFTAILEISNATPHDKIYTIIATSLEAGFMIGYRKAKRDIKKKAVKENGKTCGRR